MGRGACGKMYSSTLAPWTVCGLKEGQTSGCECRPLVNTVYSRRVGRTSSHALRYLMM